MIRASIALPADIAQRVRTNGRPTDQRWVNATLQAGNPACSACRDANDWCADHVPY